MRFITLFSGALVATTALNILLASDAHAWEPNGWSQVGQSCGNKPSPNNSDSYYKLRKGKTSKYGVYRNKKTWQGNIKGVTLAEANAKMNEKCNCLQYSNNGGCDY